MLPVAVARYSPDGNTTYYVLPVLWMTSYFIVIERMRRIKAVTTCIFRRVRQVAAPGATSAISDCILWFASQFLSTAVAENSFRIVPSNLHLGFKLWSSGDNNIFNAIYASSRGILTTSKLSRSISENLVRHSGAIL